MMTVSESAVKVCIPAAKAKAAALAFVPINDPRIILAFMTSPFLMSFGNIITQAYSAFPTCKYKFTFLSDNTSLPSTALYNTLNDKKRTMYYRLSDRVVLIPVYKIKCLGPDADVIALSGRRLCGIVFTRQHIDFIDKDSLFFQHPDFFCCNNPVSHIHESPRW